MRIYKAYIYKKISSVKSAQNANYTKKVEVKDSTIKLTASVNAPFWSDSIFGYEVIGY